VNGLLRSMRVVPIDSMAERTTHYPLGKEAVPHILFYIEEQRRRDF